MDIGFNRKVKADWLKETLQLTASGVKRDEIEPILKNKIAKTNPGEETIRKVFIYLNRVWIDPPDYCKRLRDGGLEIFSKKPNADAAFLLTWGMCIASYPFIGRVAEATGRLLRLQGEVQAVQVNQRIREKYGDRHFVHRSVRYNLSTFLDLGALKQGVEKGVYVKGNVYRPKSDIEISWLIEAVLHTQTNSNLPFTYLIQHGSLFPFNITDLSVASLKKNPRIEIFRHGLNEELIGISDKEA
jgi:hypothetical protein